MSDSSESEWRAPCYKGRRNACRRRDAAAKEERLSRSPSSSRYSSSDETSKHEKSKETTRHTTKSRALGKG
uniref:Uncharacterized protein n=1 Tax=viral metagenome TaxID=1070528 RepID=A0A6C0DWT1_9ZZZZ